MHTLLPVILGNTTIAAILALLAFTAGRVLRRPALAHALWLLVLIKLITPPIWTLPIHLATRQPLPIAQPLAIAAQPPAALTTIVSNPAVSPEVTAAPEEPPIVPPPRPSAAAQPSPTSPIPAIVAPRDMPWTIIVLILWLLGSAIFLAIAAIRIGRFTRMLRSATDAPAELAARTRELARHLGLRTCPEVKLVPGYLSPLLWFTGRRPTILLPESLISALPPAQLDALLVHELSHLRRGDHWVRLVELAIAAICWWHPLFWLARRELHEAEEQCCDAWVIWALPQSASDYARGLLTAIEYLSAAPAAMPATASGIGRLSRLQRRLTMILTQRMPRTVTAYGYLVLIAAVLALPLVPVIAQSEGQAPGAPAAPVASAQPARVDDAVTAAAKALIVAASDPDQNVRSQAMVSLTRFGADAVPALIEALQGESREARQVAQSVLQTMGWDATPQFARLLEARDTAVRVTAAEAIMNIIADYIASAGNQPGPWGNGMPGMPMAGPTPGDPYYAAGPGGFAPGMGPMGGVYGGGSVPGGTSTRPTDDQAKLVVSALAKAATDASPAVRRPVIRGLGLLALDRVTTYRMTVVSYREDSRAGRMVITEEDPRTKQRTVRTVPVGEKFEASTYTSPFAALLPSMLPPLLAALKDADTDARRTAIELLPTDQSKDAVPELAKLLKDPAVTVRTAAATSLSRIGADASAALPALVEALKDENAQVRGSAAAAIGALRAAPAASTAAGAQPTPEEQKRRADAEIQRRMRERRSQELGR